MKVEIGSATLYLGDCREILPTLAANSVDSIVTDPPYGLGKEPDALAMLADWLASGHHDVKGSGFMGKAWDAFVPQPALWRECLRVLKPGGHLLAFAGTRTHDLMTLGLRIAGFEIRDTIMWVYGSGFPKSLDVSKAIDKARDDRDDVLEVTSTLADLAAAAGITRADIDVHMGTSDMGGWWLSTLRHRCACPSVENWTRLRDFIPGAHVLDDLVWRLNGRKGSPGEAWGKRAVVGSASVPIGHAFAGSTYGGDSSGRVVDLTSPATPDAERWQGWGTALKPALEPITVARKPLAGTVAANVLAHGTGALNIDGCRVGDEARYNAPAGNVAGGNSLNMSAVRMPQDAEGRAVTGRWPSNLIHDGSAEVLDLFPDTKAGVAVRHRSGGKNCHSGEAKPAMPDMGYGDSGSAARFFYCAKASKADRGAGNAHPTVKPTALMRYLCRLVTPPGGVVLDPFMGSGSTGNAAMFEGFRFIGCELDPDYAAIARARIAATEQRVADACRRIEDAQRQGRLIA